MRNLKLIAFGMLMMCALAGVGVVLLAQSNIKPDRIVFFGPRTPSATDASSTAVARRGRHQRLSKTAPYLIDGADGHVGERRGQSSLGVVGR